MFYNKSKKKLFYLKSTCLIKFIKVSSTYKKVFAKYPLSLNKIINLKYE